MTVKLAWAGISEERMPMRRYLERPGDRKMAISTVLMRSSWVWLMIPVVLLLAGCQSSESFERDLTKPPVSEVEISDEEIAHMAGTLNQGEIVTSLAASEKATSAEVKHFARQMVTQHESALAYLEQELKMSDIKPERHRSSSELEANAQRLADTLNSEPEGDRFDRTYMEAQVSLHESALNLLDSTLIPNAEDKRLQAVLAGMRTTVNQHLEDARRLLRTVP